MTDSVSQFADNGDHDFIITCSERTFYTHRVVLKKSPYFATLFRHGFKETRQGSMAVTEDDPALFQLMLRILYGADGEDIQYNLQSPVVGNGQIYQSIGKPTISFNSQVSETMRAQSKRDPTMEESELACAVLLRTLQFYALLAKYQLSA
jgi:hypothetical protein